MNTQSNQNDIVQPTPSGVLEELLEGNAGGFEPVTQEQVEKTIRNSQQSLLKMQLQKKTKMITAYTKDHNLWLEETALLLRSGKLSELDVDNLIEEIEGMTRTEKQALRSNLIIVLLHLLKYVYQPDKRSSSWMSSINEHRRRIELALEDSPSLKPYLSEVFATCYSKARRDAAKETNLPLYAFPESSPFVVEEVLNPDWLPSVKGSDYQ